MADGIIQIGDDQSLQRSSVAAEPTRNQIQGTEAPDIIFGTEGNDEILALGGDDRIFGSAGNDILNGGAGKDIADYSFVGQAITLLPRGVFEGGGSNGGQLQSIETIIGPGGQPNTIDGSSGAGGTSFDINLEANKLNVNNVPNVGTLKFRVENFVDVNGTPNADKIVGSAANNRLDGGGGNDSLTGGAGDDTLIGGDGADTLLGTNASARGIGERDILTGGVGGDRFILGNGSGSYYKAAGNGDLAQITDFFSGDQIQLGVGETYNVQNKTSGFDVFVKTGSTQDLIASVQFGTSTPSSSARVSSLASEPSTDLLAALPSGDFTVSTGQTVGGIFVG